VQGNLYKTKTKIRKEGREKRLFAKKKKKKKNMGNTCLQHAEGANATVKQNKKGGGKKEVWALRAGR